MERFRAGDQEAFRELYRLYAPGLLAFLASRCRSRSDAADVAQDVWLKAWKARSRFDGRHFRGWLFQITRRWLIDVHRKRRETISPENWDPEDQRPSETAESITALQDCLKSVGGEYVAVIRAQLEGADVAQIATRLGIEESTVYTRVNRGKKQLRDCVERKLA